MLNSSKQVSWEYCPGTAGIGAALLLNQQFQSTDRVENSSSKVLMTALWSTKQLEKALRQQAVPAHYATRSKASQTAGTPR